MRNHVQCSIELLFQSLYYCIPFEHKASSSLWDLDDIVCEEKKSFFCKNFYCQVIKNNNNFFLITSLSLSLQFRHRKSQLRDRLNLVMVMQSIFIVSLLHRIQQPILDGQLMGVSVEQMRRKLRRAMKAVGLHHQIFQLLSIPISVRSHYFVRESICNLRIMS